MDHIVDLNFDKMAHVEIVQELRPHLGALPPAIQRNREIQALLADPFLYDRLGAAELVESIERTEKGYLVKTQNYSVSVEVVYIREGRKIGPAEFRLEFSEPVFLN